MVWPLRPEEFLARYYRRRHFVSHGPAGRVRPLLQALGAESLEQYLVRRREPVQVWYQTHEGDYGVLDASAKDAKWLYRTGLTVFVPEVGELAPWKQRLGAQLGFEVVEGLDLDKRKMERVVREFGIKLIGADLAFFFYAGHGVQVEGINYLIPVNMRADGISSGDVKLAGISLNAALDYLPAKTRVFIDYLAESFGPEPYWDQPQGTRKAAQTKPRRAGSNMRIPPEDIAR